MKNSILEFYNLHIMLFDMIWQAGVKLKDSYCYASGYTLMCNKWTYFFMCISSQGFLHCYHLKM